MATQRLPIPGGDDGDWGDILNGFLEVSINSDGTLNSNAVATALPSPISTTNLGSGTASSSTYLRGDGTWATPGGGVALDSTATDIQPLGTRAAGSNAEAARADHVHPTTGLVTSSQIGAANGVASLDGASHVPAAQLTAANIPVLNQNTTGNAATATNLAGGVTFPGYVAPTVVTLTDGSSVSLNAALGNDFRWSLSSNSHSLAVPSNPVNGQSITIAIKYGGNYTPLFNSVFDFGTAGQPAWSAASGKTDYVGFRYDSALNGGAGEWAYQGVILGLTS